MVYEEGSGTRCLGRISSQRAQMKAQAKGRRESAMQSDHPYKQEYWKEELLCTETVAQMVVGFVLLEPYQRDGPM